MQGKHSSDLPTTCIPSWLFVCLFLDVNIKGEIFSLVWQIEAQMTRIRSPSCHSVSVKWQQLSRDAPEPLQAPAWVPSLFHNDRLLVYGFIPHCTQVRCSIPHPMGKTMNFAIALPLTPTPFPLLGITVPLWVPGWGSSWFLLGGEGVARRAAVPLTHPGNRNTNRARVYLLFQATLRALIQEKEFCTMVSTTELQKTTGTVRFKS